MKNILRLFPEQIRTNLQRELENRWKEVQEIRLRLNKPIEINYHHHVKWLNEHIFTERDSLYVINQLSEHSLYRLEDELREGYITIHGGHRVGIAGEVNTLHGKLKQIQHVTFFNIRVAKEILGVADEIIPYLYRGNLISNTLIIGAPQTGKTTLIRDIARTISNGIYDQNSKKVAIIDERSEIAASLNGIPQHNVGKRTDVMDACPKVDGMMMMIRSMSPDVIIVDEIGKKEDVKALMEAIYAGVSIICTIHGQSLIELQQRPSIKPLLYSQVFSTYIILHKTYDGNFKFDVFDTFGKKLKKTVK